MTEDRNPSTFPFLEGLVEWIDIYEDQLDNFSVGPAKFKRKFAHWDEGQEVDCLCFNFVEGLVQEFDTMGELIREVKIQLVWSTT